MFAWLKRRSKPVLPAVPPSPHWHIKQTEREDNGLVVEEYDASDVDIKELQSRTGMQRVFDRVTGKFK